MATQQTEDEKSERVLLVGRGDETYTDNSIRTSKYTILSFIPVAVGEQFRRQANVYFLAMGILMLIGEYVTYFETAVSPWGTLLPLAFVVALSLLQEGATDYARHMSDDENNRFECTILQRMGEGSDQPATEAEEEVVVVVNANGLASAGDADVEGGSATKEAKIKYQSVQRKQIRAGNLVLLRNRDTVPADMVLLASSGDKGSVYIETSSIDGETNLKLRTCAKPVSKKNIGASGKSTLGKSVSYFETLEQTISRIVCQTVLLSPDGTSALEARETEDGNGLTRTSTRRRSTVARLRNMVSRRQVNLTASSGEYVATVTCELPNGSVDTFNGKLTLPPEELGESSVEVPLSAENFLLRGAFLRNTEWAIGVACYTGSDTKLVKNSTKTPSKFSHLDLLVNRTVLGILFVMFAIIVTLAIISTIVTKNSFTQLWYLAYNSNTGMRWPYMPDLPSPIWQSNSANFIQNLFFFTTLLTNYVPLSLYITLELVTLAMMIFVDNDVNMYHKETDTPAKARSTIVTDLGQIKYIFSDKTGTLTQNVMQFKRCSVDGMMFGAPIVKSAPKSDDISEGRSKERTAAINSHDSITEAFHPLRKLLIGADIPYLDAPSEATIHDDDDNAEEAKKKAFPLTYNAEMFLRVMSICHTVVVEKDNDEEVVATAEEPKMKSLLAWSKRSKSKDPTSSSQGKETTSNLVVESKDDHQTMETGNVADVKPGNNGAPSGHSYQAESPDEGALVGGASSIFGFQVLSNDSNGVRLSCSSPSVLCNRSVANQLKNGELTSKALATISTSPGWFKYLADMNDGSNDESMASSFGSEGNGTNKSEDLILPRDETWTVMAVNKFDSTRKRMSVLVRSPPELGSIPMVLCKGADSSMLDGDVCEGFDLDGEDDDEENKWRRASFLAIQAHLGDFASEGLRTLVLGVRILTEQECEDWLDQYNEATTSIKNRAEMLTEAAQHIEKGLHIVGCTAIEDKLQDGVPETISNLAAAGIKLWVLTGDKRETAIEIGYSTKLLTPTMDLLQVAVSDSSEAEQENLSPEMRVKLNVAKQFMLLTKDGELAEYQKSALDKDSKVTLWQRFKNTICKRKFSNSNGSEMEEDESERTLEGSGKKKDVRHLAEDIIGRFDSEATMTVPSSPTSAASSEVPAFEENQGIDQGRPKVFNKAESARNELGGKWSDKWQITMSLRHKALASSLVPSTEKVSFANKNDLLKRGSILGDVAGSSDLLDIDISDHKRILERLFAVDQDVRYGRLNKHVLPEIEEDTSVAGDIVGGRGHSSISIGTKDFKSPRALVIEGAALSHLLGDPLFEEMIFAVASCCDAVIACRVSPKQKALLVNMVRKYVSPTPITLAIGDGANDVGMIQSAHVGVGISGLEGQQAVNSSDFAIAQFRFLEELLLIHGRWSFTRMAKIVLFCFYKNAVLATILVIYTEASLWSGTPLFDTWLQGGFNFVATIPIIFTGCFDRDLDKMYVRRNPSLYAAGPNNDELSTRKRIRWMLITFAHAFWIYFSCRAVVSNESEMTGLEGDFPGNGEGSWETLGTAMYTVLIFTLAYKVLFETQSIITGVWPPCTCRKIPGEDSWLSRLPYTLVLGVFCSSIGLYFFFVAMYSILSTAVVSFYPFIGVGIAVFLVRVATWMAILLVPTAACVWDVAIKVFGNMYFPTQTQIHAEIASKALSDSKRSHSDNSAEKTYISGEGSANELAQPLLEEIN